MLVSGNNLTSHDLYVKLLLVYGKHFKFVCFLFTEGSNMVLLRHTWTADLIVNAL